MRKECKRNRLRVKAGERQILKTKWREEAKKGQRHRQARNKGKNKRFQIQWAV
jgi:hypothetical protein